MLKLSPRPYSETAAQVLRHSGLPPLLARLYAARGVHAPEEMKHRLAELLPYSAMKHCEAAAARLADAIARGE
jgi:single-stranded-DNA-specific exonuclease